MQSPPQATSLHNQSPLLSRISRTRCSQIEVPIIPVKQEDQCSQIQSVSQNRTSVSGGLTEIQLKFDFLENEWKTARTDKIVENSHKALDDLMKDEAQMKKDQKMDTPEIDFDQKKGLQQIGKEGPRLRSQTQNQRVQMEKQSNDGRAISVVKKNIENIKKIQLQNSFLKEKQEIQLKNYEKKMGPSYNLSVKSLKFNKLRYEMKLKKQPRDFSVISILESNSVITPFKFNQQLPAKQQHSSINICKRAPVPLFDNKEKENFSQPKNVASKFQNYNQNQQRAFAQCSTFKLPFSSARCSKKPSQKETPKVCQGNQRVLLEGLKNEVLQLKLKSDKVLKGVQGFKSTHVATQGLACEERRKGIRQLFEQICTQLTNLRNKVVKGLD